MKRVMIAGLVAAVAAGLVAAATLDSHQDADPTEPGTAGAATPGEQARTSTDAYFERYVDDTGRVVRPDQGGDTVSEGQGYALLLAAAAGQRSRFRLVWQWTRTNLQRPDRLFSWHWDAARGVTDPQAATDADLDIARALVVAGNRFGDGRLRRAGIEVGTSVLRNETTVLAGARVLLPGPWANRTPPLLINPSYYSPVALQVLHRATHDDQWLDLEQGTRAVVVQVATGDLPPEWATVSATGEANPTPSPSGAPSTFGWEAVRLPIRLAESCNAEDRQIAASLDGRPGTCPARSAPRPSRGPVVRPQRPQRATRTLPRRTGIRRQRRGPGTRRTTATPGRRSPGSRRSTDAWAAARWRRDRRAAR
jgi:hypothetical protein